jgi:hypothetical protein
MAKKKKKNHGGLKFLAVLVGLGFIITMISMAGKTEVGQRVLGKREDRRVENTRLTPRFSYAAAKVRVTHGEIYNQAGAPLDLTATNEFSIDRASARASDDIKVERTATEVAPGVKAIPYDAINGAYSEVLTKDYRYESPIETGDPWTRSVVEPYFYGTELDDHFIPMIDDLMGFELRSLPTKGATTQATTTGTTPAAAGFVRPAVNGPTPPSAVTKSYSYSFDMETYQRVLPILADRDNITAPPETPVNVTLGFDNRGLLRFADVSVDSAIATTLALQRGEKQAAFYSYTMEVIDISGEAEKIDVPSNTVDAPDDTAPLP